MYRELSSLSVETALQRLSSLPGCLLLESVKADGAIQSKPQGRYSFAMADPFESVVVPVGDQQPLAKVESLLKKYSAETIDGLPPMQGGVAGMFGYDLNRSFEKINAAEHDEFELPAMVVGAYDVVIAWDHFENKTWLISQGFPETNPAARKKRAARRADFFEGLLLEDEPIGTNSKAPTPSQVLAAARLSPQFSCGHPALDQLTSDFSAEDYVAAVRKCIDYIVGGDVFQINLSQRLMHPATTDSVTLYQRLRICNPAPFSCYFDMTGISNTDAQIVSASPERLVSVRERTVETRPIKGTRPRTGQPLVDLREQERLLASQKDRAENIMIVDLMRNDLASVCQDDSICVTQLCQPEAYQSVLHLVSAVEGKLRPDSSLCDLLAAIFPGGSITGAPKIRAMEIIAELEPTSRGAYCGSVGYLGFDGSADLNILIRTITASKGWWQVPVGGGVVVQSDPEAEYKETWTKAASMLQAIIE